MTPWIFAIVILAALLHASWNVLVKVSTDRVVALALLQALMGVMGIVLLVFVPFPAQGSWPYAFASGVLHTGYNLFLARSYKFGDLGLVYPLARGTAPLLTLGGTLIFTHDTLSPLAMAGVIVLIIGIWLMALSRSVFSAQRVTIGFALTTSLFIGCYTVVDGLGARAAGDATAYTGLLYLFDAIGMIIAAAFLRGRGALITVAATWKTGIVGALLSGSAYWIVIWAMAHAPIAAVAAVRETSVLFALLFSSRVLKEQFSWQRVVGVLCVVAGAMALRG